MSCCQALKTEFVLDRLVYKHEAHAWSQAHTRSWLITNAKSYLLVRCFLATLMLATLLWSFADAAEEGHGGYWFIYWTHWTLGVEVAYLTVAAFATWRFAGTDPAPVSATGGTPWWIKGMWVLYDVSFPGTFFVFALYWLLVYTPPARVLSCMTHGLNFAVLLVDSLLTCSSLFILHGLYFVLYALTFILFSVIFFAAKGRNENNEKFIYSSLDWDGAPGAAAVTVVALLFVAVPIVYLFLWTIVFARQRKSGPHIAKAAGADGIDSKPLSPTALDVEMVSSSA